MASIYNDDLCSIRFPEADDSIREICSILLIRDITLKADVIAGQLQNDSCFTINSVSPDDDIVGYLRSNSVDIMLFNSLSLGRDYITDLTRELDAQLSDIPSAVDINDKDIELSNELGRSFRTLFILGDPSYDPIGKARQLRGWLLMRYTGPDMLYEKLFHCAQVFFASIGGRREHEGFGYLCHGAVYLMLHPYSYFSGMRELCTKIESKCGESNHKLVNELRAELRSIVKGLPLDVKSSFFGLSPEESDKKIGELEIMYKCAELVSPSCRTIIEIIRNGH